MAFYKRLLILSFSLFSLSCSKGFQASNDFELVDSASQGGDPTTPPGPDTPALPPPDSDTGYKMEPLLWEKARPNEGIFWSTFEYDLLETEAHDILNAQDMKRFCPTYASLTEKQKINVAGQLIAAIVQFESSFDPLSQMKEDLGTDPITGQQVQSEGLMQLSYQDMIPYPFCDFDWQADKLLPPKDPKRTILDPFRNLYCGTRILAQQVKRKGWIVLGSGAYWAVIKSDSRYEKIDEIAALVGALKVCR